MLLYLGIGGHGDRLTKLFGGHKPCYDGQWPLTGRYFKRCFIQKGIPAQMFSCESCKIFKKPYFVEYLWGTASSFWRSINLKWYKKRKLNIPYMHIYIKYILYIYTYIYKWSYLSYDRMYIYTHIHIYTYICTYIYIYIYIYIFKHVNTYIYIYT